MTAQALFRTTAIQEALQPFSAAEALSLWVSSAASFSVCPVLFLQERQCLLDLSSPQAILHTVGAQA